MAKQSKGLLHVDQMMQQGGCPLVAGNMRAKIVHLSYAQSGRNVASTCTTVEYYQYFSVFSCGRCTVYCQSMIPNAASN